MKGKVISLLCLLFVSASFAQVQKVPKKYLPEYEQKKMIVTPGISPWWHISLKTDLMGTRTLGAFVKADNDSMLMLKHIMSVPYLKSLIPQKIKWYDQDSLLTNDTVPLVLTFAGGGTKSVLQYKSTKGRIEYSGALLLGSGGDMWVFYPMDHSLLSLFQMKELESLEFQVKFKGESVPVKYTISDAAKKKIMKLANKYDKIQLK